MLQHNDMQSFNLSVVFKNVQWNFELLKITAGLSALIGCGLLWLPNLFPTATLLDTSGTNATQMSLLWAISKALSHPADELSICDSSITSYTPEEMILLINETCSMFLISLLLHFGVSFRDLHIIYISSHYLVFRLGGSQRVCTTTWLNDFWGLYPAEELWGVLWSVILDPELHSGREFKSPNNL